ILSETNHHMVPIVSGRYIYINSNLTLQQQKYVRLFIDYLTSKKTQVNLALSLMLVPATLEAQKDPQIANQPVLKSIFHATRYGKAMPPNIEMRAVWDACGPILTDLMSGNILPEDGAFLMQKRAEINNMSLKK
ncbi:MAG: hypothetical protein K2X39_05900, partial [Silvanigrellaceae bacterium]|nr:hypothetical protein [Silvanigrellaceae bacterium]